MRKFLWPRGLRPKGQKEPSLLRSRRPKESEEKQHKEKYEEKYAEQLGGQNFKYKYRKYKTKCLKKNIQVNSDDSHLKTNQEKYKHYKFLYLSKK